MRIYGRLLEHKEKKNKIFLCDDSSMITKVTPAFLTMLCYRFQFPEDIRRGDKTWRRSKDIPYDDYDKRHRYKIIADIVCDDDNGNGPKYLKVYDPIFFVEVLYNEELDSYMSTKDFRCKYDVSQSTLNDWLIKGKISGAFQKYGVWHIPKDATPPQNRE